MTVPVPDEWWRDGPPRTSAELLAAHLERAARTNPTLPMALIGQALADLDELYATAHGDPTWPQKRATLLAALHARAARWSRLTPEPVPSQESAIPPETTGQPRSCGDPDCDCDVPFAGSRSGAFTEITSFADIEGGRWVYMVDLPGFEGVRATVTRDPGGLLDGRWEATTRDPDALARAVESMGSTLGLETVRTQSGREHVFFVRSVTAPAVWPGDAEVSGWFTPISTLPRYEPKREPE